MAKMARRGLLKIEGKNLSAGVFRVDAIPKALAFTFTEPARRENALASSRSTADPGHRRSLVEAAEQSFALQHEGKARCAGLGDADGGR